MSKEKEPNPSAVTVEGDEKDKEKLHAQTILRPTVQAAATIQSIEDKVSINALITELSDQAQQVIGGDMKRAEVMLLSQAHTLDSLFGGFARKSHDTEHLEHLKVHMNLALKCQNQCRMTLEALAEIKNPKPYIQNNKAQYQQVNNGVAPNNETITRAHAEKSKQSNELLEDTGHEQQWVDTGTPEEAIRDDKELEALGE